MSTKLKRLASLLILTVGLLLGGVYYNKPYIKAMAAQTIGNTLRIRFSTTINHTGYRSAGISYEIEQTLQEIKKEERRNKLVLHETKLLKISMIFPVNPIDVKEVPVENRMYVTNTPTVNKRVESSTDSDVIEIVQLGEEVYVEQRIETFKDGELIDSWCELDDGSYIKSEYLTEDNLIPFGECIITYYCPCSKCCGWSNHPTASGVYPQEGITVAADPSIPFGTILVIDGHEYVVQDRGGSIYGNHLDVFLNSHSVCLEKGVDYKEVYIKK